MMKRPDGETVVVDETLRVDKSWFEDSSGARHAGDPIRIERETLADGKLRLTLTPRSDGAVDVVALLLSRDAAVENLRAGITAR